MEHLLGKRIKVYLLTYVGNSDHPLQYTVEGKVHHINGPVLELQSVQGSNPMGGRITKDQGINTTSVYCIRYEILE